MDGYVFTVDVEIEQSSAIGAICLIEIDMTTMLSSARNDMCRPRTETPYGG